MVFLRTTHRHTHTHNHLTALCPGLPRRTDTRRTIHPFRPTLIINHPSSAVLYGAPTYTIHKLQRVQNNAARVILQAPRRSHVTLLLSTLHWPPVQQRIDFKVALVTSKICSTSTLSYLHCLLQDRRLLRHCADHSPRRQS